MDLAEEDVYKPEFDAVWNVIKNWDRWHEADPEHDIPAGYSSTTGKDVMAILNAIRPVKKKGADLTLQFFKGNKPKLGHYFIGSTKVLMIGPIRIFVSRGD